MRERDGRPVGVTEPKGDDPADVGMSASPPGGNTRGLRRVALILLAALVVCSLIGSAVRRLLLQRGDEAGAPGGLEGGNEEGDRGGEFERSLRAAIEANPNDVAALGSLTNLLATVGRSDEAIDLYERVLVVDPENLEARLDFATTLADAGKRADAEVQFRRLIDREVADPNPVFYLAELYRTWDPPRTAEAVALYRRVTELAPDAYLGEQAREELGNLVPRIAPSAASPVGGALEEANG